MVEGGANDVGELGGGPHTSVGIVGEVRPLTRQ